ncbi:MAG: hypothetical protein ACYC33_00295 [Thermoleophilia bacterium]
MKRADQIVSAIAWTILASVMFAVFGVLFAEAVAGVLTRLDLVSSGSSALAQDVVRLAGGLGLLGISLVYRLTAGNENAGSLAAWLAGWGLVLYSAAALVSFVDEHAAPVILLAVLAVWVAYRLARFFAIYDPKGLDGGD